MDVIQTRLANLRALSAQLLEEYGTQKEVALALDLSPSFLSQLASGKKMGEDVARKIEAAQRLPHGWMDQQRHGIRESAPTSNTGSHPLRIDPQTIAAALRLVRLSFANLSLDFNNEEDGLPLAFAYEYLFRRGEAAVTPDNLVDFSKRLATRVMEKQNDVDEARTGNDRSAGGGHRLTG